MYFVRKHIAKTSIVKKIKLKSKIFCKFTRIFVVQINQNHAMWYIYTATELSDITATPRKMGGLKTSSYIYHKILTTLK